MKFYIEILRTRAMENVMANCEFPVLLAVYVESMRILPFVKGLTGLTDV